MRTRWPLSGFVLLCFTMPLWADPPGKKEAPTYQIPYRLTDVKHLLVRAKINGKGPFNFIVDTGAPALFVSTAVSRKVGVEADSKGWGIFDRFEIEGGLVIPKVRGRVEDPFQLEAMNGLGLEGAHVDGMIGYSILARYRLEVDFTRDKMTWTRLDYDPAPPEGLNGKGGAPPQLDALASAMKMMGTLLGTKATPEIALHGFLGIELADRDGAVTVKSLLPRGPAAAAGLKVGDRITHFQGKAVGTAAEIRRLCARLTAGDPVRFTLARETDSPSITFKAGEGL